MEVVMTDAEIIDSLKKDLDVQVLVTETLQSTITAQNIIVENKNETIGYLLEKNSKHQETIDCLRLECYQFAKKWEEGFWNPMVHARDFWRNEAIDALRKISTSEGLTLRALKEYAASVVNNFDSGDAA